MATVNNARFRGLGVHVNPSDSTEAILAAAKLDWKTVPMPMLIQGRTENRPSAFKSLVKSDDGYELAVATKDYRPIHNVQIVDSMKRIADAGEMTITEVGSLDHGRRVFASCQMHGSFDLKPTGQQLSPERALAIHGQSWDSISPEDRSRLDRTELHGIMGSGHVPGISFTFEGLAERLVCLNGAKISRSAASRFSMRHVTDFDAQAQRRLQNCIAAIRLEFSKYRESAEKLQSAKWDSEITRAFCCELLAPEFFAEAMARTDLPMKSLTETKSQGFSLDQVLQRSAIYLNSDVLTRGEQKIKLTRPAERVIELVGTQPGHDLADGTAWNAVNAVTYYVDHERGRGESSAVESSLFGEGASLKQSALDLALAYTEAIYA